MNVTTLPLEEIRKNLEAKGLSEADIEKVLDITKSTNETIAKSKQAAKPTSRETRVIASMKVVDHCPDCQGEDDYLLYGFHYKSTNGSQSRFVVDETLPPADVDGCKTVKSIKNYKMCPTCMNKERLLGKVERLLTDPRNHPAVQKLVSSLEGKES